MKNFFHIITKEGMLICFHERDFVAVRDFTLVIRDPSTKGLARIPLTQAMRDELIFNQFGMKMIGLCALDDHRRQTDFQNLAE